MTQKELTKVFIVITNWKKHFGLHVVSIVVSKYCKGCEGNAGPLLSTMAQQ